MALKRIFLMTDFQVFLLFSSADETVVTSTMIRIKVVRPKFFSPIGTGTAEDPF